MLSKLFGKKTETLKENEVRLVVPEEVYTVLNYKHDGLPGVMAINSALKDFDHQGIFQWHLSVIIDFDESEIIENGMPSENERSIVDPFCDKLDEEIKAGGNALFLARETWNKTRRLVWMVYDPEIVNQHLQFVIDNYRHPRPFDFRMEVDKEWKQPQWYFEVLISEQKRTVN